MNLYERGFKLIWITQLGFEQVDFCNDGDLNKDSN